MEKSANVSPDPHDDNAGETAARRRFQATNFCDNTAPVVCCRAIFQEMRFVLPILMLVLAAPLQAVPRQSALDALKKLPPEQRANLARIEGRDGTPTPERWYFQVYSPDAENGVREEVVAERRVVARRALSQFVATLQLYDVLGGAVRVDSDQAVKLARRYAEANGISVASYDYTLAKPFFEAAPGWAVRCKDAAGQTVGSLTIAAETGEVIAHDGFPIAPSINVAQLTAASPPMAARRTREKADRPEPVQEGPRTYRGRRVRRAEPPSPADPIRQVVKPLRRLIHDLLPF